MKSKKIFFTVYFISIFVLGNILCFISMPSQAKLTLNKMEVNAQKKLKTSQFASRNIRIAIYDEDNLTTPSYAYYTSPNNEFSALTVLADRKTNYKLTSLTTADISAHKLKTSDYDVFIIPDNPPRENITNLIKEYWLGGGGILNFDSGISYLCYSGMLPPESEGSHGYNTYWKKAPSQFQNITARHSVCKSYHISDTYEEYYRDYDTFNWSALQTSSIASELIKISTTLNVQNQVTALARDPLNGGGRIVHIAAHTNAFLGSMDNLVFDAIEWLCPHPKGRILFDLSHNPDLGIDPWDTLSDTPGYYSIFRNNLVNRSYTVDKLYPSASGNLTQLNLASYDLLWIDFPGWTFTINEINAVDNWLSIEGGGLLIIGDYDGPADKDQAKHINFLLFPLDMEINLSIGGGASALYDNFIHPTAENCEQVFPLAPGYINYTGDAFPIWGKGPNVIVAGQEYGKGRVILIADHAILRNSRINLYDHFQYGINVVNWLTAGEADVLVYIDSIPKSSAPEDLNDNLYRGPVATALNDLGFKFYLTNNSYYFNYSLGIKSWDLVIIDNNFRNLGTYYKDVLNYLKAGGKLIITTWQYDATDSWKLNNYLGFKYNNRFNDPLNVYIWNASHPIFNTPADYSTSKITTYEIITTPSYFQFSNLTCYNNATAIAGMTETLKPNGSAIIVGAGGRAVVNAMILTVYENDTDDSTFPDALEIWENEIAFLLPSSSGGPTPDNPTDNDDDNGGGDNEDNSLLMIILICAVLGVIAIVATIFIFKKKRKK